MADYSEDLLDHSDSRAVLRRDIPWDIYQTARLITDRDLQLLRRYDKKEAAYQAKLLQEVGSREASEIHRCRAEARGLAGASPRVDRRRAVAGVVAAPPTASSRLCLCLPVCVCRRAPRISRPSSRC